MFDNGLETVYCLFKKDGDKDILIRVYKDKDTADTEAERKNDFYNFVDPDDINSDFYYVKPFKICI